MTFGTKKKLECCGYPTVKTFWRCVYSFRQITRTWRTDGRTPYDGIGRACIASRCKKLSGALYLWYIDRCRLCCVEDHCHRYVFCRRGFTLTRSHHRLANFRRNRPRQLFTSVTSQLPNSPSTPPNTLQYHWSVQLVSQT